jgi:hypothetical protein
MGKEFRSLLERLYDCSPPWSALTCQRFGVALLKLDLYVERLCTKSENPTHGSEWMVSDPFYSEGVDTGESHQRQRLCQK